MISDLHLRPGSDGVRRRLLSLAGELAARARAGRRTRLCILGDLFAFWAERPRLMRRLYGPELEVLAELSRAGCPVEVLDGNRDFGYGRVLAEAAGAEPRGERAELSLAGRKALLIHGDQLLTADRGYQRYKRVIRSAPARWAARRLPEPLVLAVVRRLEAVSASHRASPRKPRGLAALDLAAGARLAEAAGADYLICGHVHESAELELPAAAGGRPRKLLVLGEWGEAGADILEWPEGEEPRLTRWPAP